jgi:hypothetical protein
VAEQRIDQLVVVDVLFVELDLPDLIMGDRPDELADLLDLSLPGVDEVCGARDTTAPEAQESCSWGAISPRRSPWVPGMDVSRTQLFTMFSTVENLETSCPARPLNARSSACHRH